MHQHHLSPVMLALSIFCSILLSLFANGCLSVKAPQPTPPVVTDSTLASALVSSADIKTIAGLEQARPQLIELNDHLDTTNSTPYNFYVAHSWNDRARGTVMMQNAITQYVDAATATQAIQTYATNYSIVPADTIGDHSIAYYRGGSDEDPAMLTYRFALGQYVAKIQLYDVTNNNAIPDSDKQTTLLSLAVPLAKVQADKLIAFLQGTYIPPKPNAAMMLLPTSLTGASYVGQVPVTDQDWLGVSFDVKPDTLRGYVTGGLSRFKLIDQPDQVVEVVVMQFEQRKQAKTFQEELTANLDNTDTTKIDLPADLPAKQAAAIQRPGLIELQALKGKYVIDIAMFAPFAEQAELNRETLINVSREVLQQFHPL